MQAAERRPESHGLIPVWLHSRTGHVLRIDSWRRLDIGSKAYAWIYPLHSGQLGGATGAAGAAVADLALFGFGMTGSWLWWLRRRYKWCLTNNLLARQTFESAGAKQHRRSGER